MTPSSIFSTQTDEVLERTDVASKLGMAINSVMAAGSEREAWQLAVDAAAYLTDSDSSIAMEVMPNSRATARAAMSLSLRMNDVFPIAPDSQAAYIVGTDNMVVADDLTTEDRFVPGAFLVRSGVQSTVSTRFDLDGGHWGLLGVSWNETGQAGNLNRQDFTVFCRVAGWAIVQLRRREVLEIQAKRDVLTEVWNRGSTLAALKKMIGAEKNPTVMLVDLDGFKAINDEIGHWAGDAVLSTVAGRIERRVPVGGLVGRIGGDEFLVVLDDEHLDSERVASSLISAVEEAIGLDHRVVHVSASVGVAQAIPGEDSASVVRRADQAMYEAKGAGRGQVRFGETPDPVLGVVVTDVTDGPIVDPSECDLSTVDDAIAGVRVLTQPVFDTCTGEPAGFKAVVRGPVGHQLEQEKNLVALATTYGRLGELELAAKQHALGLHLPPGTRLFIDIEPALFIDQDWFAELLAIWAESGCSHRVVAEITDQMIFISPGRLLSAVDACRELGWQIAVRNVGARTESLAALRWIKPDVVKLDAGALSDRPHGHIYHLLAAVAAVRDGGLIEVVVGGVDTESQLEIARLFDAEMVQGRFLAGPRNPRRSIANSEIQVEKQILSSRLRSPIDRLDGRTATKRDLLALSRQIESEAVTPDTVLVARMESSEFLTKRTRRQYVAIARRCGFVGVVAPGLSGVAGAMMPGVRTAGLGPDDPLAGSWQVVVISPTTSIALVAHQLELVESGEVVDNMDRQMRYRVLTDRSEVEAIARNLLRRF